ncbi:hypothetical protein IGI04_031040 [Brassica rapa subsp. trilocularis]|uniref:Uncharacterized protein n=1 Tax=Brassica rapa subsp. trilocularis TaxID=1813537 RepID=A0ABQ7LSH0_BRACM|nr:hypothetical protein IGI04_031040 [Brassica rapa subsp. trilocularis]
MDGDFPMLFGARADIHAPNHHCKRKMKSGLSIDCEQLVILIQKEEDWPALDSELDEIQAISKEFSEFSIAYIPRSLKFRTNSLAKGVRSRASRSAFVNSFAPSWLAPQAIPVGCQKRE